VSALEREVSALERGVCIREVSALERERGVSTRERGVCIKEREVKCKNVPLNDNLKHAQKLELSSPQLPDIRLLTLHWRKLKNKYINELKWRGLK
jgi:hypothetical protein